MSDAMEQRWEAFGTEYEPYSWHVQAMDAAGESIRNIACGLSKEDAERICRDHNFALMRDEMMTFLQDEPETDAEIHAWMDTRDNLLARIEKEEL
jgi:hypothetical protein